MAATPDVRPVTSPGWGLPWNSGVPSPRLPRLFAPQHVTAPAAVSAQPKPLPPVATCVTPLLRPGRSTGVVRSVAEAPAAELPQHFTPPLSVTMQVSNDAGLIWTHPVQGGGGAVFVSPVAGAPTMASPLTPTPVTPGVAICAPVSTLKRRTAPVELAAQKLSPSGSRSTP